MIDKIKLALAVLLVAAGIVAFYLLSDHALVLRMLAVLGGIIAAVIVMWTTPMGKTALTFSRESAAETRKVVWPNRKETIQTTLTVFVFVVVMGIFLWIVDSLWALGVNFLMRQG
jgi:preprotein translocase subunit SecE